jgi:hypothetical protein
LRDILYNYSNYLDVSAGDDLGRRVSRVVLVGFMGSGKSSVGRELARRTGAEFVDADEWIERKADGPSGPFSRRRGNRRSARGRGPRCGRSSR